MQEKVIELVGSIFKIDKNGIDLKTHFFQDLGVDSIELLSFISGLEREFNVVVPDADIETFYCVKNVLNFLEKAKG